MCDNEIFLVRCQMMSLQDETEPERERITIDLTTEAVTQLRAYTDRRGGRGVRKAMLSRLVEWFLSQPDSVKSAVVGWADDDLRKAQADAIRKIADDVEHGKVKEVPTGVLNGGRVSFPNVATESSSTESIRSPGPAPEVESQQVGRAVRSGARRKPLGK